MRCSMTAFHRSSPGTEHRLIGQALRHLLARRIPGRHSTSSTSTPPTEKCTFQRTLTPPEGQGVSRRRRTSARRMILTLVAPWRNRSFFAAIRGSLRAIGFEIEPFGGDEYAVRAVPGQSCLALAEKEAIFWRCWTASPRTPDGSGSEDMINDRIATMSCKAAVKGNHRLSEREADGTHRPASDSWKIPTPARTAGLPSICHQQIRAGEKIQEDRLRRKEA